MAIFRMGIQRPTAKQGELCSVLCVAWMGGEFEVEWIQVYVWLSPFAVHGKHFVSHNIVNQLYSHIK